MSLLACLQRGSQETTINKSGWSSAAPHSALWPGRAACFMKRAGPTSNLTSAASNFYTLVSDIPLHWEAALLDRLKLHGS